MILSLTPANQQVAHIFNIKRSILHWTCHPSELMCSRMHTALQYNTQLNYIHTLINQNMWLIFYTFLFVRCIFIFPFFSFRFFSFGFIVALFIFERVPVAVSNVGPDVHLGFVYGECNLHTYINGVALLNMAKGERWQERCVDVRYANDNSARADTAYGDRHKYTYIKKTSNSLWCIALFAHHVENLYSFFSLINDWCQRKVFAKIDTTRS